MAVRVLRAGDWSTSSTLSCHMPLSPFPPAVCFILAVRPLYTEGAFEAIMN